MFERNVYKMMRLKRILPLLLAAALLLVLTGCKEEAKNPKVADVMTKVRSELEFPEMAEKTKEDLSSFGYDELDPADVEESAYIIASSGLTAEEVFIVKLKDEAKAEDVKKMMETRRDQIAATAQDYTPELMDQINKAVIETKGPYAFFAITGDNAKAKQIFDEMF